MFYVLLLLSVFFCEELKQFLTGYVGFELVGCDVSVPYHLHVNAVSVLRLYAVCNDVSPCYVYSPYLM